MPRTYLRALLRHWRAFALTGAVPAAVGIAASILDRDVPAVWWFASFGTALLVAQYRVFVETEKKSLSLATEVASLKGTQERGRELRDDLGSFMSRGDDLLLEFRRQFVFFTDPKYVPYPPAGDPFLEPTRFNRYRDWLQDVREFLLETPEFGLGALAVFDSADGLPDISENTTISQLTQMADDIAARNRRLSKMMERFT